MKKPLISLFFCAILAACSSQKMQETNKNAPATTSPQGIEEALRISDENSHVTRNGRTLSILTDNGTYREFTNTTDYGCDNFDCDAYHYEGTYADKKFFRVGSLSSEFYFPDYLVSRKTGQVTSLVGPVTELNLSPDQQYIVNAVGGDAGPDAAIYIWQIIEDELKQVYAYAPKGLYANFRIRGWVDRNTVLIEDIAGYDDRCKIPTNTAGWSTSRWLLRQNENGWSLEKTDVECKPPYHPA